MKLSIAAGFGTFAMRVSNDKPLHEFGTAKELLKIGSADEEELAVVIAQQHTKQSLASALAITGPEKWAGASFKLAKQHAYTITENPSNPPKPSTTYVKNRDSRSTPGWGIARRSIRRDSLKVSVVSSAASNSDELRGCT